VVKDSWPVLEASAGVIGAFSWLVGLVPCDGSRERLGAGREVRRGFGGVGVAATVGRAVSSGGVGVGCAVGVD